MRIYTLLIFIILSVPVFAQQSQVYTNNIASYKEAVDLFDKEKYGAAIKAFERVLKHEDDENSEIHANASFYKALCALKLFNRNAEYLLEQFILNYPESPKVKQAYFLLGRYNFRKKEWERVLEWYDHLDVYDLTNEERSEFYFRSGYAHLQLGNKEAASKNFYEIKDTENEYFAPANYYYGHIAYSEKNYETALNAFRKIQDHPKFAVVVPYYITQILYHQEKYDELISYASPLLEQATTKRAPEIARLIGEAHYHKGEYEAAIPYFEQYKAANRKIPRQDNYQLGYCYYQVGDCDKAITYLSKLTYEEDEYAQTSTYYMADCYLKNEDKKAAKAAFKKAYEINIDQVITEDAFFSYAKLSYELSYDPYNEAVNAFLGYLEAYPNSDRSEEVYNYLVNIYLSAKNYSTAIKSLESIENKNIKLKEVYQRLVYNNAVERFQNGDYSKAIELFEKSLKELVLQELTTSAYFWMAESNYRLRNYDQSIDDYTTFIFKPQAILLEEFELAHYGIGYAYFKNKTYKDAARWFRKYVDFTKNTDSLRISDAYIRIGDCYFINKDYYISLEFYEKAIEYGKRDVDYALYQYAMAQGVLRKPEKQIELLKQLTDEYPNSNYLDAAQYQLGKTFMNQNQSADALAYFNLVVESDKYNSFRKKALMDISTIYYNNGKYEAALETSKQLVNENPNYTDSKGAIQLIENIYTDLGDIENYESYINTLAFMDVSDAALDSLTYESAERFYMQSDCNAAIDKLGKYLDKFAQPIFTLEANYYRGECLYKAGRTEEALTNFENVLALNYNSFTEPSVVKAAFINYNNKNFAAAKENYKLMKEVAEYPENKLAAAVGLMRTTYKLKEYSEAKSAAEVVLQIEKIKPSLREEAHFVMAKSYQSIGERDSAIIHFEYIVTSSQSEKAAESQYNIAYMVYETGNLDSAEVEVFELVNQTPSYEYWLAKGLILLSDVYREKGDAFQAKATLQSIIENYEGDESLLQETNEKLDALVNEEKPAENLEETPMEIDMGNDSYDQLFEEELPVEENLPNSNDENNE